MNRGVNAFSICKGEKEARCHHMGLRATYFFNLVASGRIEIGHGEKNITTRQIEGERGKPAYGGRTREGVKCEEKNGCSNYHAET